MKSHEREKVMNGARLTGLWKNKSKNGNHFLGGNLGTARVIVLPNTYKEKDTDPDYNLYIVPKNDKQEGAEEDVPF